MNRTQWRTCPDYTRRLTGVLWITTLLIAVTFLPGGCPLGEQAGDLGSAPALSGDDVDPDVQGAQNQDSEPQIQNDQGDDGADVSDPSPLNQAPIAVAGDDYTISGRKPVTLDGRRSNDPDGDALTFAWKQVGGPALTLSAANTAQPRFDAPATDNNISLTFELTVSDGRVSDSDTITITVTPPSVLVSASWANATGDVNADMHWQLPSGDYVPVDRAGWGLTGIESASRVEGLIEDGIHALWVEVGGAARTAELVYRVDFLEYQFFLDEFVPGEIKRLIVLDVEDGVPHLLFNGWLDGAHSESGRPIGVHNVEVLGGWRDGSDNMNGDIHLRTPDGTWQDVWRQGWGIQGFERAYLPAEIPLEDGDYRIKMELAGSGRSADVVFDMLFAGLPFRVERRVAGGKTFKIGVDVVNGEPFVVFNGWLESHEDGAGALSGRRPLEAVGGFRNASDTVNLDINARLPDGTWIGSDSSGWDLQAYEHLGLSPDAPLADGTYRFKFELHGNARFADVDYQAALANWSYHYGGLMAGGTEHAIDISVVGGVATEIANTWR